MSMFEPIEDDPHASKLVNTYKLANDLLRQFGLAELGWTFELSKEKTFLGKCYFDRKLIVYSEYFLHAPTEQIEDTIRHEIAHAIAGPRHGHNATWKAIAIACGATPERCAPPNVKSSAQYNYVMRCESCGREWKRYRMKKRNFGSRCPHCHVPVRIFKIVR